GVGKASSSILRVKDMDFMVKEFLKVLQKNLYYYMVHYRNNYNACDLLATFADPVCHFYFCDLGGKSYETMLNLQAQLLLAKIARPANASPPQANQPHKDEEDDDEDDEDEVGARTQQPKVSGVI